MALKRPKNSAMLKIRLHSFLGDGFLSLRVKPMLAAESALLPGRHLLSFTLLGFANLFHFQNSPIWYTCSTCRSKGKEGLKDDISNVLHFIGVNFLCVVL